MPKAGQYLKSVFGDPLPTKSVIESRILNTAEAAALASALRTDADDFYYSSCVTILEAINGLVRQCYTWSTVKFYYSTFYAARALLALRGDCLFYLRQTPFYIKNTAGSAPTGKRGNTHQAIWSLFSEVCDGHLLISQKIGIADPFEWMRDRREDANYHLSRFVEPSIPDHFRFVESSGVRQLLEAYILDGQNDTDTYTFLPDHAMYAYALRAVLLVAHELEGLSGALINGGEIRFLELIGRDSHGPYRRLMDLLRRGFKTDD